MARRAARLDAPILCATGSRVAARLIAVVAVAIAEAMAGRHAYRRGNTTGAPRHGGRCLLPYTVNDDSRRRGYLNRYPRGVR